MKVFAVLRTILAALLVVGCGGGEDSEISTGSTDGRAHVLSISPEAVLQVQLPFPDGYRYSCNQNSNDTPTHNTQYTRYDLDFGMSVSSIVVAAAEGTVHRYPNESQNGGFGWFASVDHGNGNWTIYAHLSGFIATDGQHVVSGQPIAFSGGEANQPGSGTSTGPHLHFGVHIGTSYGTSQPMAVYGRDATTGNLGWYSTSATSDFVCGIPGGHTYEARPIGAVFSEYQCRRLTDSSILCWSGNPTTCEDGSNHTRFFKGQDGRYQSESDFGTWSWCLNDLYTKSVKTAVNIFDELDNGYGVGGGDPDPTPSATPVNLKLDFDLMSIQGTELYAGEAILYPN